MFYRYGSYRDGSYRDGNGVFLGWRDLDFIFFLGIECIVNFNREVDVVKNESELNYSVLV